MTKHRFRESIKSFFGHHVDPEKDEQLKGSKIEIDDKVTKILKLIKNEESGGISIDNSKKEPLVQLIEDFHKHYENLYEQYDHLTGELRKKIRGKRQKDTSSSSSSDSDSDCSSKDGGSKNGQLGNEFQKIAEGTKQELETANLEIADLKRKLTATSGEKDALNSDYLASLSKVQNAEEIIRNLKLEHERSESEKSKLAVENEELRHKLDTATKIEAEVNQRLKDLKRENSNLSDEASTQVKSLVDQLNTLQHELESLHSRKAELEVQLERKIQAISDYAIEIEKAKEEIASKTEDHQRVLQEKEGLLAQTNDLEFEVNSLKNQKGELEEELQTKIEDNGQLREGKVVLQGLISELEKTLAERGLEFTALQVKLASAENETSALLEKLNNLKQELDSLQTQRTELELQLERQKQESSERLADLEQIIEDLKRDLEMKGDELTTSAENVHNIEVKLRLSNQKLRVTEQLLTENEDSFRKAEAKLLEEQTMLEERIQTLCGIITANNEVHCRMIIDISENVSSTLTGFEAVVGKFEEGYRNYENCIEETSKELRTAKHWVEETKCEKKRLMNEVTNLIEQLRDQKEQESVLRERVEKLQSKANKGEGEKEKLVKAVKQLEKKVELLERVMKEKDEGLVDLGEEKREAIRQLCMWIDYHRSRCDDLKEILSKTVRVQRAI